MGGEKMRALTRSQKILLRRWIEESDIDSAEDLSWEQWEILETINDTEILWQNVNCFISDYNREML